MPSSPGTPRYRFSLHILSPARRTLVHEGRELPLMPRCFDLLVLLVERRNEAVSRGEILDTVWSDVVVTDLRDPLILQYEPNRKQVLSEDRTYRILKFAE